MTDLIAPGLFAVFLWWFTTGAILYLDGLPRSTFAASLGAGTAVALAALVGLGVSSGHTTVAAAYCAFTCGVLVWGWQELTFLTGVLTGPRKTPSPAGATEFQRFRHAIAAILWHELAILAGALLVVAVTWGQPNQVGAWTYLILWAMRQSAKLNLFLGVRNLSRELLPEHMAYLGSFFRKRALNLLFPVSVTAGTAVAALMFARAAAPDATPHETAGLVLAGSLLALAVLEHWFLVLPLPVNALWAWGLKSRERRRARRQPIAEPSTIR